MIALKNTRVTLLKLYVSQDIDMIAENRESMESNSRLTNALQEYLRQEYSPDAIESARPAAEKRVALKAKDWCIKHNCTTSEADYIKLARNAINRFLVNWEDKIPGEDDRGHRLGKSSYEDKII